MPFAGYEDFDSCVADNSDKNDPEAYCAEIHYQVTGEYPGQSSEADFYDERDQLIKTALRAIRDTDQEPTVEKLKDISNRAVSVGGA